MKLERRTPDGLMKVELEGDSQKELVKELSSFQEVFENCECIAVIDGKVHKSSKVQFRVREVEENEYYEMVCVEPGPLFGYKKAFGQHKKGGGLFPKRADKDDENIVLGKNGWFKWVGNEKKS